MKVPSMAARRSHLVVATLFGAIALSFGALSIAADHDDAPRAVVAFGDLNLSSELGAATLYHRIEGAADEVCESYDEDEFDLRALAQLKTCRENAIADAVRQVGEPELFGIYNSRNHQRR